MVEAGGVAALLAVAQNHKSEAAVAAALGCLVRLLPHPPAIDHFLGAGEPGGQHQQLVLGSLVVWGRRRVGLTVRRPSARDDGA